MTDLMTTVLDLAHAGERMVRWVLWMNLWTLALLAVAIGADLLLRRRVAAAWRVFLYVPIAVRLLMPVQWAAPLAVVAGPAPESAWTLHLGAGPDAAAPAVQLAGAPGQPVASGAASSLRPVVIPAIYLLVAAALGVRWAVGLRALASVRRASEPAPERLQRLSARLPIRIHAQAGPMVIGSIRPTLILPRAAADSDDVGCIIAHESAHAARRDPLIAAAIHALTILAWPIVALWVAGSRVRVLMEQACDDRALRGRDSAARAEYARTLLRFATPGPGAPTVLSFGSGVRSRIGALRFTRRWRSPLQLAAVAPLMVLPLACSSAPPAKEAQFELVPPGDEAPEGAFKDQVLVSIHLLSWWPEHPKLKFDVAQVSSPLWPPQVTLDPPPAEDHQLTGDELQKVLEAARQHDGILAAPRLVLKSTERGSIRIGNDDAKGTPKDGYFFGLTTSRNLGTGSTQTILDFDEFAPDPEGKSIRDMKFDIDKGMTMAVLATGLKGGHMRLILITPEPFPPERGGNAFLDALDYPQITLMTVLGELSAKPDLAALHGACTGGPIAPRPLVVGASDKWARDIADAKGYHGTPLPEAWAELVPMDRVRAYQDVMGRQRGYRHVASPMAVLRPGQWGTLEATFNDKARQPVGSRLEFRAEPSSGTTAIWMRWSRPVQGEHSGIAESDGLAIPEGYALVALIPPRLSADPWRSIVVTPRVVWRPGDYPVQTFRVDIEPPPAPK